MPGRLAALVFAALLIACDGDPENGGGALPEQPEWWPESIDWPPPRPDDWTGQWPPEDTDPGWWVRRVRGETEAPSEENPPDRGGSLGDHDFARAFGHISAIGTILGTDDEPDCGVFSLQQFGLEQVERCHPFPGKVVGAACERATDQTRAEKSCRERCARVADTQCERHELHTPEAHLRWSCKTDLTLSVPPSPPMAICEARFLCECWSS